MLSSPIPRWRDVVEQEKDNTRQMFGQVPNQGATWGRDVWVVGGKVADPTVLQSGPGASAILSDAALSRFDHQRRQCCPTDGRRLQLLENLIGRQASERPLVRLLRLVRRHRATNDWSLLNRQIHEGNLTALLATGAASPSFRVSLQIIVSLIK